MTQPKFDIWQFQMRLSGRLMRWAGFSIGTGIAMVATGDPVAHAKKFNQGMGSQFIGWGAIDGLLAFIGAQYAARKTTAFDFHTPEHQDSVRRNLRTLLSINAGLDIFYVLGGLWLARNKGKDNAFWRGSGWGIVGQGAFLFLFDLIHALQLK